jgi:hydroxymethylglutaryl-CoA lyase
MREQAYLREVGPRDGLQLVRTIMPAEQKIAWCHAEADAGVKEIEVTSFVPARVIPQFGDADAVAREALKIANLDASVLVPNLTGAMRAFEAGVRNVSFVLSASEKHNMANVRRTTDQSLEEFSKIVAVRDGRTASGTWLSAAIGTAFGCTMEGGVAESRVIDIAEKLARAGADEIVLADTVGYGNPSQVRRLFAAAAKALGAMPLRAHFHDTRGLGIANVSAAVDVGVRRFDASLGGLGGCPFAPGATGNIDMEDAVFLLESLGFDTGIDIEALIAVRAMVELWLPRERFFGMVARAGLPLDYWQRIAVN